MPNLEINIGANVAAAIRGVKSLADAFEQSYDEIAAGSAAFARVSASIDEMAAAAIRANQTFDGIGASAVKAITPLNTLESRLDEIRAAIGRAGTVQGAANLSAQYEILNRTLQDTRQEVTQAANAAVGLGNAFNIVSKQAITAGQAMNRLAPAIKPVLFNLKVIPPAATQAAAAMDKLRKSSGQGATALNDFSRIIQDSPYGIIGIGNNITQLADSFGNLKRSAGSTGGAFKALLSSAGGFGGIGLLISGIITAVTFASIGFSNWTRGLAGNKKQVDENAKAYQDFIKSLKGAEAVVTEAAGSVQGQVRQLQVLANVARDTTASEEQRGRALEKLKSINKDYFSDIKLTEAGLSSLTDKVKEYTEAITQQAIVQSLVSEIGRIGGEYLKQRAAVETLRASIKQFAEDKGLKTQFDQNGRAILDFTGKNAIAQGQLRKLNTQLAEQEEKLKPLQAEYTTLGNTLQDAQKDLLRFADASGKGSNTKKETDALKERIAALEQLGRTTAQNIELAGLRIQLINRDSLKEGFKPSELKNLIDNVIEEAFPQREVDIELKTKIKINRDREDMGSIADAVLPGGVIPEGAFDPIIKQATEIATLQAQRVRKKISETIGAAIQGGIVDSFAEVGNAIGVGLSGALDIGDTIELAAQSLLGVLGGVLQEVGKQIIATSTLVVLLKDALASLFANPYAGLAVGIGLVALGALLKNIKFNIPAFADGVTGFSGGLALVGEVGPELVRLPSGSDVIPNNRLGDFNTGNVTLAPSIWFSGDRFKIMLERVDKSRSNLG